MPEEVTLSSLLNIDNFAEILQSPAAIDLFGDITGEYVSNLSPEELKSQLGRLTVFLNADASSWKRNS